MATTTLPNAVTRKSIINLVAVNLGTVIIAIVFQWPIMLMVWPFFLQNIVIGYYSRKRILALRRFSTKGLKINGRYVSPTEYRQFLRDSFRLVPPDIFCISFIRLKHC